jgi:hypothetical protein
MLVWCFIFASGFLKLVFVKVCILAVSYSCYLRRWVEKCAARKDASPLLINIEAFVEYVASYYSEDRYILFTVLRDYFAGFTLS